MEIVSGLHQLKTPMPSPALPYIIPYVFEDGDGLSLYDAGYGTPAAIETMTSELARLGYEPKHIRRLMISHAHPDHLGMAAWIKEQSPDCELVLLGREAEWVKSRWRDNEAWSRMSDVWMVRHGMPQAEIDAANEAGAVAPNSPTVRAGERPAGASNGAAAGQRREGAGRGFGYPDPDVVLEDGEVYEFGPWRLQAVWTPGHTPGHMCMYELNHRFMFTGDHVLPYISPNVSLHADQEGTSPLSDFRASLQKVADFDTSIALPAHEFTIPDLKERCAVLLHHHDDRLTEVREAIGSDRSTARDVSQRVKWNTGPFDDFNLFMKRSALGETLSHLRLLEDTGRARRVEADGAILWERA